MCGGGRWRPASGRWWWPPMTLPDRGRCEKAGGRAVLTTFGPSVRVRPHLRGAGPSIPAARMMSSSTYRATCRRSDAGPCAPASRRSPTRRSTSRHWRRQSPARRRRTIQRRQGGRERVGPGRLRALYFTRARAPWARAQLLHHIGLYAYRRGALARSSKLPPSPLEKRERLEQLRALEAGMRIDVALVDTPRSGWTRRKIWNARGRCSRREERGMNVWVRSPIRASPGPIRISPASKIIPT